MALLRYPDTVKADEDRYRYLCAALEALRRKHNTRAGDVSPEARKFRLAWKAPHRAVVGEILKYRPLCATRDFVPVDDEPDPTLATLKREGYSDWKSVDVKRLTGADLDRVVGAAPIPPDPIEDFTTYTEVDGGDDLTVTASKITVSTMRRDVVDYCYCDKGVDHFGATFEHLYNIQVTYNNANCVCGWWAVSNAIDHIKGWDNNNSQAIHFSFYGAVDTLRFRNEEGAGSQDDIVPDIALSTDYYCTTERTGETAIETRVYTDAARTNLYDTVSLSVTSGRRYRYMFVTVSKYVAGTPDSVSGFIENLDLQESSGPAVPVLVNAYRRRRS